MGRPNKVNFKGMSALERRAYYIWLNQKNREGVAYALSDFTLWYLKNISQKEWVRPHVGRIDHSKGYSFLNIVMQEQADNNRERNNRRGNPGRMHRRVFAISILTGGKREFPSKVAAARYFGISEKTVYNHCEGRTKQYFKFGNKTKNRHLKIRFEWVK